MKKIRIASLFFVILIVSATYGCTPYTISDDYIKQYNDELHIVFGDFSYDSVKEYDEAMGIDRHYYYKWTVYYTDSYGNKESAVIKNTIQFERNIDMIFHEAVRKNLIREVLNEYVTECSDARTGYGTKEYDYSVNIAISIKLTDYYDAVEGKVKDYSFFDLTSTDVNDLIERQLLRITNVTYGFADQREEKVLSGSELETEVGYLTEITKRINDIIPIEKACYDVYVNELDHEGKNDIAVERRDLNFQ